MIKLFLVYICLLLQGLETCTAKSSKVNNALLSNSNFLKNYHYSNITHIKSNDFKNHLINTFETCSWDALVVANIPGLSWEYYREHESVFKNIQKLLERSGTMMFYGPLKRSVKFLRKTQYTLQEIQHWKALKSILTQTKE